MLDKARDVFFELRRCIGMICFIKERRLGKYTRKLQKTSRVNKEDAHASRWHSCEDLERRQEVFKATLVETLVKTRIIQDSD